MLYSPTYTLVSIRGLNMAHVCGLTYYSLLSMPQACTGHRQTQVSCTPTGWKLLPWGRRGGAVCPLVRNWDWAGGGPEGDLGNWGWVGAGRGARAAGE